MHADLQTTDIMTRWHHPHAVMFSDTTDKRDIRKIVAYTLSKLDPTAGKTDSSFSRARQRSPATTSPS